MKQYRIRSADFVLPGESLVPDAVMSEEDLQKIKDLTHPEATEIDESSYVGNIVKRPDNG